MQLTPSVARDAGRGTEPASARLRGDNVIRGAAWLVETPHTGTAVYVRDCSEIPLVGTKVGMVEDVKGVQSEFHRQPLLNSPILVDREVSIDKARSMTSTTWGRVAVECTEVIADKGKGIWIDDLVALDIAAVAALTRS